MFVVEFFFFFVFSDLSVYICWCVKVRDVCVVSVYMFGQSVLWVEFKFQFIRQVLMYEFCVFIYVRVDYFFDLFGLQ